MNSVMSKLQDFYKLSGLSRILDIVLAVSYIYVAWIVVHYLSSHLYVKWCVPPTVMGFVMAPFLVASPHCTGLRWVITTGGQQIVTMWTVIGTWLFNLAINYTIKTKND